MPQAKVARFGARQSFMSQVSETVAPGAELFALCQTATADGALSPRELQSLRAWREHADASNVPAWKFVSGLVEHILEIGRAAPADLHALYTALESCLPAELRRKPSAIRLADREWTLRNVPTGERVRNEVIASAHFLIAGLNNRHAAIIEKYAKAGAPLLLVRDKDSPQSPNTVEVRAASGKQLGFVPEQHASELAPLLDQGARYRAHLASVHNGAHAPLLIVQAYLYPPDATLGTQHTAARRMAKHGPSKVWWFVRFAVAALIVVGVAFALRM
jgi:HIRAN domain